MCFKMIKSLFAKKKKKEYVEDPPGRTFKRIDTGRYFGCERVVTDESRIAKAKQHKIDQIKTLELVPMFIRYAYKKRNNSDESPKIISAHIVFQKEIFAKKWNMIHVTEVSFTVLAHEFDEFEKMAGVSLSKDFRDLSAKENNEPYQGEERRKEKRS